MNEAVPNAQGSPQASNHVARLLTITGLVQGVGFRDAGRRRARELQVRGWIRNASDGSVQALVQGEADAVEQMLEWAHQGPPAARVERVVVQEADAESSEVFEVRH